MSNIFSFFIPYKDIFIECKYILLIQIYFSLNIDMNTLNVKITVIR